MLDRVMASLVAGVWVAMNLWWMWPGNFSLGESLPLHVCDLCGILAVVVLARGWRVARTLLYFWGIGLSAWGFITPDLAHGLGSVRFWMFWGNHFIVVVPAIYDVVVGGYRPRWRDWLVGALGSLGYVAVILPMDIGLGVNYGYVGDSLPGQATIFDLLGDWPMRTVWIVLLVEALLAGMTLPWEVARRYTAGRNMQRRQTCRPVKRN
jgi:hypothetical integral membrane protein (TIGR02206 family)